MSLSGDITNNFSPIIFFPSLRIARENGLSYSTLQQDADIYPNLGLGIGAIASLTREAFVASDRQKVVGVVPLDKKTSIPEGSHLVKDSNAPLPNPKLGYISASCWSVEYDNPFSLAILKNGKNMIGEKLFAMSPLKNIVIPVEIVSSHYVDPKGEKVRS